MPLEHDTQRTRSFDTLEQAAHLNIARTAAALEHALAEALKPHHITPTQYNVLRILRGAGENGLCRREVRERLTTPVPDTTRLLDRMEAAGLLERKRDASDRRFVTTRITHEGLTLIDRLDTPVRELHRRHFGHLEEPEVSLMIDLLDRVRQAL